MGGTLPLFCRHFVNERGRIGGPVALHYALNTLGAALGCLLAGFVLIPACGLTGSIALAAAVNLASALVAASTRLVRPVDPGPRALPESSMRRGPRAAITVLFMMTGFAAVGQEVVWTRFLSLVIPNNTHTYTLTLAAVLIGIVIGSLAASRGLDRMRTRARWFACLQIGFALLVLAPFSLPPATWKGIGGSLEVIFALLLPPAILSGASFPLAVRMLVDDPALAGFSAGRMGAVNTLGGILGSLAVGFLVLPKLGLAAALALTTGTSLLAGTAAWLYLDRETRLVVRSAAVAVGAALWIALPLASGARLPADWLTDDGELVDFREGLEANVAVIRRGNALSLEIDRKWQGSDERSHQIVAAHVPALLHPRPRRVLVVGVGAGQTAERFLMHDPIALDCVDVEPVIFDLIGPHFGGAWLADPRVRLIRADGRNMLSHATERYDIISLELGQVTRPGVAGFYTVDFYRHVRARLEPGGLVAQFVPLPSLSLPLLRSVVRSFLEVFPTSVLWYNRSELLLIGAADSLALDPGRLALLESDARLRDDLRYSQWGGPSHWLNQPHAFLGGLLADSRGLAALAAGGELLRDDRPWLEYAAVEMDPERSSQNEHAFVDAIRPYLATAGDALGLELADATSEGAARMQERNLGDIAATAELRLLRGFQRRWPPERLLPLVERAIAANPESANARSAAARLHSRLGRPDRAAAELSKAIEIRPDDSRAHRQLAMILHRQRRLAEAIPHYRSALAARADAPTHFNLGAALLESGSLDEARASFEAALRLDPAHVEAQRQLERIRALDAIGSVRGGRAGD
jgi:spermidine synthase